MLGGIGSGKSYVARHLAALAPAAVVDADRLAHEVLDRAATDGRLAALFGEGMIRADGRPDRGALAAEVFGNAEQRERLESLIHPPVLAAIRERVASHARGEGPALLVLDVPLLIESGLHRYCDVLVFVDADDALREARAAARGLVAEAWRRREAAQISPGRKRVRADLVVRSDDRVDQRLLPLLRDLGVLRGAPSSDALTRD